MSYFDLTAEQREKAALPRYIARPPEPDFAAIQDRRERSDAHYHWQHSWELHEDTPRGGWGTLVRQGWEVRSIHAGRAFDFDQPDQERRDEIDRWADGFINDTGTPDLIWPEDRDAVLREVARRLREATADGFLLRALVSSTSPRKERS